MKLNFLIISDSVTPDRVGDICFGRILNELGEKLITENGDGIYLSYPCDSIIGGILIWIYSLSIV